MSVVSLLRPPAVLHMRKLQRACACTAAPRCRATHTTVTAALPATSGPAQQEAWRQAQAVAAAPPPTAAYIHLPFCHRKCRYCDFPVIAVGMNADTDQVRHNMEGYVDLVLQEMRATQQLNEGQPLTSVFFGGGTPSLLSLPLLEALLQELDRRFGIVPGAEISIEADPGTFDAARLRSYLRMGVSRVSVGVQAFQDSLLQLCGRAHDVADVYRAIEAVYAADVPVWSLDLMSGLPELTEDMWAHSLAQALDGSPHHISVYDLQVEDHTPFARLYSPGEAPLPEEDAAARMYGAASTSLRSAGYEHYEVSNYAKPGHRCAHNMVYWEGRPYYGFGMGAASYLAARRFSRPKRLGAYRTWVQQLVADADARGAQLPSGNLPPESSDDRLLDTIMLRLRLSDGLDLGQLAQQFPDGKQAAGIMLGALGKHMEAGLVLYEPAAAAGRSPGSPESSNSSRQSSRQSGQGKGSATGVVRLADPQGFIVSNEIISDVFAAFDITTSSREDE